MEVIKQEDNKIEALKKVSIFSDIKDNPAAMGIVVHMMEMKNYSAGSLLTVQGKEGSEFFVLINGTVSISKNTPEGDSYKVVVLKHDNYPSFGEGGLMDGEVRSATINCDTPVECMVLSKVKFNEFCDKNPQFALPVFRKIAQGLMLRLNQTSNDLMLLHKALMDEIRGS